MCQPPYFYPPGRASFAAGAEWLKFPCVIRNSLYFFLFGREHLSILNWTQQETKGIRGRPLSEADRNRGAVGKFQLLM